ncbi:MAG: nucleotidyl transferase AbiEii/AbiGii toxin family protein [Deltaproteobacteria bacterium]|nr:nucleotidyl transferase AbiEii/AbiGii toxin family protein [Deltaproteobacteria bacterium]MBW1961251.1 nucleotidyl transferase AbiEii/AbiGii toxin family protein [Deltaproteobacteria bacterium]
MFEEILSEKALKVADSLSVQLSDFYLAGGTGLSLQLGHRFSDDLDFFSGNPFNIDAVIYAIQPNTVFYSSKGTIHCEIKGIRLSLLFYAVPLVYPPIRWHHIRIADIRDIAAEKIKTISQRGSKKDFVDLYAIIKLKFSLSEVCDIFKKRFGKSDINFYHVLKSLTFFEDAEEEPMPRIRQPGTMWDWEAIKEFFLSNIDLFEKELRQPLNP